MCVYIFAGRFQPFHNGHYQVFSRLCERLSPQDTLVLGVISPYESVTILDKAVAEAAAEHHTPERNPWPVATPLFAVSSIAKDSPCASQIITTLLPRPEYGWSTICEWFPQKRVWVIPDAGEHFDEIKSNYFEKLGDTVLRIPDDSGISGWELRDWYYDDNYLQFAKYVPASIADIYFRKKPRKARDDFQLRAKVFENDSKWVKDVEINNVPNEYFKLSHRIGNLVDVGGGTGYLSWYLHNHQESSIDSVTLVDISPNMLEEAKRKEGFENIYVHNTKLELFCNATSKKYDTVLCRQVLHYVDDVPFALKSLKRVLGPNGLLYIGQIVVPDEESKEWLNRLMKDISPNRKRLFTKENLVRLSSREGFEIIHEEQTEFFERLSALYKRKPDFFDERSQDSLLKKMIATATQSIRETLSIKTSEDDLFFTVHFCHLFMKLKDT